MTGITIRAIPMRYSGVQFRSTLEADWAATLDSLGIEWQYEPIGMQLSSGALYRPDFYLPKITTWLEVKGPDGERLDKTRELADAVRCLSSCNPERCSHYWWPDQCVAVGLAPIRGEITSYLIEADGGYENHDALSTCRDCGNVWWCTATGSFGCRACRGGDGDHHIGPVCAPFIQLRQLTP